MIKLIPETQKALGTESSRSQPREQRTGHVPPREVHRANWPVFGRLRLAIALLTIVVGMQACSKKPALAVLGEDSSNLQAIRSLEGEITTRAEKRVNFQLFSFEDAFNKANQDFATGKGLYDIVCQYNFSLGSFVQNNYVYTLDELRNMEPNLPTAFEKDIFTNVWMEVGYYYSNPLDPRSSPKVIGLPFAANTMLLVCNKAMFDSKSNRQKYKELFNKELSPPTTLEELGQVASFFTSTNENEKTYGICMQGATGGWLYYEWCALLQAQGVKLFQKDYGWQKNDNLKFNVTSKEAKAATRFIMNMKAFNAGNYVAVDGGEQRRIMQDGKTAMALMWSDYIPAMVFRAAGGIDDRFIFAPTPGTLSMLAGGSFYVNRKSSDPTNAYRVINFILQQTNQIKLAKGGLCSPLRSAYTEEVFEAVPYAKALKLSLERGTYQIEAGVDADDISTALTTAVQSVWNGKSDIDKALAACERTVLEQRQAKLQITPQQTPAK